MSKTSTLQTPFRRRAEGRTNYAKRMAFLKSGKVRAIVRKSTNHMRVQFVESKDGIDRVVASAYSKELNEFSYKGHGGNIPAAYLTGLLAGARFKHAKREGDVIVDIGIQPPQHGSRLFAAVKGIADAGISVKADPVSFPKEDRLHGKHVDAFAKGDASKMNATQFARYAKEKTDAKAFSSMIEHTKKTILESVKA